VRIYDAAVVTTRTPRAGHAGKAVVRILAHDDSPSLQDARNDRRIDVRYQSGERHCVEGHRQARDSHVVFKRDRFTGQRAAIKASYLATPTPRVVRVFLRSGPVPLAPIGTDKHWRGLVAMPLHEVIEHLKLRDDGASKALCLLATEIEPQRPGDFLNLFNVDEREHASKYIFAPGLLLRASALTGSSPRCLPRKSDDAVFGHLVAT
jgi:hypothetical protein